MRTIFLFENEVFALQCYLHISYRALTMDLGFWQYGKPFISKAPDFFWCLRLLTKMWLNLWSFLSQIVETDVETIQDNDLKFSERNRLKSHSHSILPIIDLIFELSAQYCIKIGFYLEGCMTPLWTQIVKNFIHDCLHWPLKPIFTVAGWKVASFAQKEYTKLTLEYSPQKLTLVA